MHNKVTLTINNKKYIGYNNIHPQFLSALSNLFYSGQYNRTSSDNTNFGVSALSIHPIFSLTGNIANSSALLNSVSSVGIYAFNNINDASVAYGNTLSTLIGYPLSILNNNGINTYSLSSIDNFSFIVSQTYTYSPSADNTTQYIKIGSFSIKNNYSTPSGTYSYFPFASINILDLTNTVYKTLFPTQKIGIQWNINLNNIVNSSVNSVNGNIHDTFKSNLKNILSSSSVTSSFSTTSFKISNIIAFNSPGLAYVNNGISSNAFILTSSVTSLTLNNYVVTYTNTYTNNTNNFQNIGSLLLIGSGDINNNFPIAWINANDIWGTPIRVVNPNEVITFTWKLDLTPYQINNGLAGSPKLKLTS